MTPEQRQLIEKAFEEFLLARIKKLRGLNLDDLEMNPFLLRLYSSENALGLSSPEAVIEWRINQRMERGTVTSLGTALQKAAAVFADDTGVEGSDLVKRKRFTPGGRTQTYYIQVKSGPNTVPKDLAKAHSDLLDKAAAFNRGSVPVFAMAYGNQSQISGIVRRYVTTMTLIGRDFWSFISDEPDMMEQVYDVARHVSEQFRDARGQSLKEVMQETIERVKEQFVAEYGVDFWDALLADNS